MTVEMLMIIVGGPGIGSGSSGCCWSGIREGERRTGALARVVGALLLHASLVMTEGKMRSTLLDSRLVILDSRFTTLSGDKE